MKFLDLDIHPSFHQALSAHGYEDATPVQEAVLASELRDRDLLVSSRTGSGKTVAFGLAIGERLLGGADHLGRPQKPLALVVAPTRELALQVQRELQWLYGPAGGRIASCVGGMDIRREQRALQDGAHIVVGTPGRLCDHLERRTLDLSGLQAVILDEADEMLDMGFRDDLERILQDAPAERRTLLFSATLPRAIEELARRFQVNAARITATSPETAHQDIEYRAHLIAARETEHAVVNVLRFHDAARTLVFGATREGVSRLCARLIERGFEAVSLSGELSQAERTRALKTLRDGRARVLVATDVAARGLDLPEVGLVIHADLPMDASVLQHRSGRTGRAGRKGISVVLAPVSRRGNAERMLRTAKVQPVWTPVPSVDEIRALDSERMVRSLAALTEEISDEDREVARRLLEERSAEELVAGLVKIQRAKHPSPEELPLTEASLARGAAKGRLPQQRERGESTVRSPFARPQDRKQRRHPSEDEGVWFRLNVGRVANADPRWLVPLICRRGKVSNREIGRIQILDRESRFQIDAASAEAFAAAARVPDQKDPSIRIERLRDGEARPPRPVTLDRPERRSFGDRTERPLPPAKTGTGEAAERPDRQATAGAGEETDRPFRPAQKSFGAGAERPYPPATKRFGEDTERPYRPAKKRFGEDADRPYSPAKKRLGEGADRPYSPAKKRFGEDTDRPYRPAKKAFGEGADRPYGPTKKSFGEGADRPYRPAKKSFGVEAERPFRPGRQPLDDRPARPSGPRSGGADRSDTRRPPRDTTSGGRPVTKRYGIGKGPSGSGSGKKKW